MSNTNLPPSEDRRISKLASEFMKELTVSDYLPQAMAWFAFYEGAKSEYLNRMLPNRDTLIKFMDWWLLTYMGSKGATENSTAIVVDRYLFELADFTGKKEDKS